MWHYILEVSTPQEGIGGNDGGLMCFTQVDVDRAEEATEMLKSEEGVSKDLWLSLNFFSQKL